MSDKPPMTEKEDLRQAMEASVRAVAPPGTGIGVDIQLISEIHIENPNFLERNFTEAEIAYCGSAPDPHASFAGRWAAKEAVVKAKMNLETGGQNLTRGGGAPLIEIEILPGNSGAPCVIQHGRALVNANKLGITEIKVSISHSGEYVAAAAIANCHRPNFKLESR